MKRVHVHSWFASLTFALVLVSSATTVEAQFTASSLAELRDFAVSPLANNVSLNLSTTGGDPHPVTGIVTPGHYWINGDHFTDPTNSIPIFLELSGTGNTYDFSGTTINLDTRKLDGFGRNLGHDSGVDVIRITGSNNMVQGVNLIGQDIALDTDPNAQRYADWATQYVVLSGDNNTVDGVDVVTRGSRTDAYGLGDAFGKGSSGGVTPFLGHRKASAFRVGDATNAVINDMHLDVNTFGHGFFVQTSTNTTLTNSTVTGELFPSQGVIDHPLYQQYGTTYHQNEIPDDLWISGNEGGVRMYTGSSGLTVDNVVVTNMRSGFATSLGSGTKTLNNVEAYGTENAFGVGGNTTITNAKADGVNGPVVVIDRDTRSNTSVEVELVGNQPINHDYALVYVNGNNIDIDISSNRPAEDFDNISVFRAAQFYYDNWRETNDTTTFDVAGYDHINSELINDTNARLILGEQAEGNVGRSQGLVVTNGKNNAYDGVSLVPTGKRTVLVHTSGLGNNGTADDGTLESNASVVELGGTLEVQPGIRITDEKLTISGDGVDGNGALYSNGQSGNGTRFGDSSNGNESTIFLDGDASIGVGVANNQLLVGRIQGTGDLTKRGAGILAIEKSSTLDGDLIVSGGEVVARNGVVNHDLTVNAGAEIRGIGNMLNTPDGVVQLDGTLDLNGRSSAGSLRGTIGLLNGSGQVTSSNPESGSGAVLEIAGDGAEGSFAGDIDGEVSVEKSGDNNQTLSGVLTHTGSTVVTGGGLFIDGTHTGGGDYTVDGATLGGTGLLQSNVAASNGATLAPGDASGTIRGNLDVGGDYSQTSDSTLAIDIDDDSTHDALTVWGVASLDGSLDLNSIDPSQYSLGDTITLINSLDSVSGKFDSISGVPVGNVDGWAAGLAVQYNAQTVTATVAIMGDLDLDGDVDIIDANGGDGFIFVQNLGTTSGATWLDGDFDGDGDVDIIDSFPSIGDGFLFVQGLGAGSGGSSASTSAVPEPNAAAILIAIGFSAISRRSRS